MGKLNVINQKKENVGTIEFSDEFFNSKVNKPILHQAVVAYLAGKRRGTVDTKTRAEVNFTGKKSVRQKGTGGARHGSRKTSPFVGGGRVFGPHPRDYSMKLNKKIKKLALTEALKYQLQEKAFIVVDTLPFTALKTKEAKKILDRLEMPQGLVILNQENEVAQKSIRNLKGFKVCLKNQLNVFDLLKYPKILLAQDTLNALKAQYLS